MASVATTAAKTARPARAPAAADITLFTQELAFMLGAGVPLSRALDVLAADAPGVRLKSMVEGLRKSVRAGRALSDAMAEQGRSFPDSYVRMVRIAEASGTLAMVLRRIHRDRSRMHGIRRKITSALAYPAFLLAVAVGAIAFISLTVIPQLKSLTAAAGLPAGSAGQGQAIGRLIGFSDWLNAHGTSVALILVLAVAGSAAALMQPQARAWLMDQLMRVPGIGGALRMALLAQFTRMLAMLLGAGLTLPDALRLTRPVMGSPRIRRAIGAMEAALQRGEDFTRPLEQARLAPAMLTSLMRVGNETGRLDASLAHAAQIFEEKLETAIERALMLLEPAIIVLISSAIGFVIYTIVGALISINDLAV